MSHLKYCPAKNEVILSKRFSNEIKEIEFDFGGYHWYIKGRKGFTDILNKIYKISKKQGGGDLIIVARLIGALDALNELGIVEKYHVKPIKQTKARPTQTSKPNV